MRFVRSCLAALFFASFATGSLLLGFVLFPMLAASGGDAVRRRSMRKLVRTAFRFFVWCGAATGLFRVDVSDGDRARLAALRGCVVASNHITLVDVIILIALMDDSTSVAKSVAARNPFYSRIVKSVFLSNDDPQGVLARSSELLADGVNLIVFPEGTRMPPDAREHRVRRGAAQIALAAGAPVQTLKISCNPMVLARGQSWYDAGDRTVVYTLRLGERIEVGASPARSHSSAVALAERIGRMIFG